jgi:hypothetical protein
MLVAYRSFKNKQLDIRSFQLIHPQYDGSAWRRKHQQRGSWHGRWIQYQSVSTRGIYSRNLGRDLSERTRKLRSWWVPKERYAWLPRSIVSDILVFSSVGNDNFRGVVDKHLPRYVNAKSKVEKSKIVSDIVNTMRSNSRIGGFVKKVPPRFELGQNYLCIF